MLINLILTLKQMQQLKLEYLYNQTYRVDPKMFKVSVHGRHPSYEEVLLTTNPSISAGVGVVLVATGRHGCIYRVSVGGNAFAIKIIPFCEQIMPPMPMSASAPMPMLSPSPTPVSTPTPTPTPTQPPASPAASISPSDSMIHDSPNDTPSALTAPVLATVRPELVEALIADKLNHLISCKVTPHLKIFVASMNGKYIPKLTRDPNGTLKFIKSIAKNLVNHSSVIITEWVEAITLKQCLEHAVAFSVPVWASLLFQIIWTLAAIQKHFPGFRHNDLSCNNILMEQAQSINIYHLGEKMWQTSEFHTRIIDFDFSVMPSHGIYNSKLNRPWCKYYGISAKTDNYYDVHFVLNEILILLDNSGSLALIPPPVREFFNEIIPAGYRGSADEFVQNSRLTENHDRAISAIDILNHELFNVLKTSNSSAGSGVGSDSDNQISHYTL